MQQGTSHVSIVLIVLHLSVIDIVEHHILMHYFIASLNLFSVV